MPTALQVWMLPMMAALFGPVMGSVVSVCETPIRWWRNVHLAVSAMAGCVATGLMLLVAYPLLMNGLGLRIDYWLIAAGATSLPMAVILIGVFGRSFVVGARTRRIGGSSLRRAVRSKENEADVLVLV